MYGTQTPVILRRVFCRFENDVKMYGTQTFRLRDCSEDEFENDVKMYGTQTRSEMTEPSPSLRMM